MEGLTKTIIALVIILLLLVYPVSYKMSSETIRITVEEKERITVGSGESISGKFIVYAKAYYNDGPESEVFENTDSFLFLKFNSADMQQSLKKGNSYRVKVAGWRIPFLSMYRNIIKEE